MSDVDFQIQGDRVYFDRIDLKGEGMTLKGRGEMTFNRVVDLQFYTVVGRDDSRLPIIGPVLAEGRVLQGGKSTAFCESEARDEAGKTVLHHLLNYTARLSDRYLETVERLLARGFKLELADHEGDTALHLMARCYDSVYDRPSLEFLLKHGADPTLRNRKGKLPWQCVGRKHHDAVALLKPGR